MPATTRVAPPSLLTKRVRAHATARGPIAVLLALLLMAFLVCAVAPAAYAETKEAQATTRVTLAAIGDLLIHESVYQSVYNSSTGKYEFAPIFKFIAPYLKNADYTIANLETRFAGPEVGYSGYPQFNCPASLGTTMREAGVDLLATANNHSMDKGWAGIVNTLDNIDRTTLAHIGTNRTQEERDRIFIKDVGGVKIAFLNYTESTNGIPLPAGRPYAVNMMDESRIVPETKAARQQGADLVVAVLHWGREYERTQAPYQRNLATRLFQGGVDAIIGSHPHVVQQIERLSVQVGGATLNRYVVYSLGNFVSNQRDRYRDSGIIVYLDIEKTSSGTSVTGVRYLPVWVQKSYAYGAPRFRVLPVAPGIGKSSDLTLSAEDKSRMDQVWSELSSHVGNAGQNVVPYSDSGASYQVALDNLVARGIMQGFADGRLGAGEAVGRQQFAKMICLTVGIPVSESNVCTFSDVTKSGPSGLYPDNYVAAATAAGVIKGTGTKTFSPHVSIARGQVVTMVVRALDKLSPGALSAPGTGYQATWPTGFSPEHGPNARRAEFNGLLKGLPLSQLDPWGAMTRGEVAQVLHNVLAKLGR